MRRLRKFSAFFLVLAMLTSMWDISAAFAAEEVGENLVIHGDLESLEAGSSLSGGNEGDISGGNADVVVFQSAGADDAKYVHGGTKSAKVTQNNNPGEGSVNFWVSLEEGKTYQLSAWVRYDEVLENTTGRELIYIRLAGTNGQDGKFYNLLGASPRIEDGFDGFVQIISTVTIDAGDLPANKLVRINISSSAGTQDNRLGETFYVDDVSCVEVSGSVSAEPVEIENNGFEEMELGDCGYPAMGSEGAGGVDTYTVSNAKAATIISEYVHSGEKSLKLENAAAGGETGLNYYMSVEKGKTYTASAWVRYDPNGTADGGTCYIRFTDCAELSWDDRVSAVLTKSDDFTKLEVSFTPSQDYSKVRLNITIAGQKGTEVGYIDDVLCIATDAAEEPIPSEEPEPQPGENLVPDGSFEEYASDAVIPTSSETGVFVGNAAGSITTDEKYVSDGKQALKVTYTGDGETTQAGVNHFVSLKKDKIYEFSADVRYDESFTGSSVFYIRMQGTSFQYADRVESAKISGSDGFVTISARYKADADYSKARLNIVMGSKTIGVIGYIDNLVCKEVPDTSFVASNNLIGENASFEFADGVFPTVGNGSIEQDTKYPHRGSYALKITHDAEKPSNDAGLNYGGGTLKAGVTYRFGAWVRYDESVQDEGSFYIRFMDDGGGGEKSYTSSPKLDGSDGYTFISTLFTPETDMNTVRLNIGMSARNGSIGYVDDVVLEETTSVAPVVGNLLKNPSFEDIHGTLPGQAAVNDYSFDSSLTKVEPVDRFTPQYIRSGDYALKVEQLTSSGSVVYKVEGLEGGGTYTFGAWVRFDETIETEERIYLRDYIDNKLTPSEYMTGTSDWTYVEHSVTLPASMTELQIQIKADTGSDTDKKFIYYIDDVSLINADPQCKIGSMSLLKKVEDSWIPAEYTDMSAGERKLVISGINNETEEAVNIIAFLKLGTAEQAEQIQSGQVTAAPKTSDAALEVSLTVPENSEGKILQSYVWNADTLEPFEKPVKILVIGNSITQHGVSESKGWLYDWGMAATKEENDYVHRLLGMAKEKNSNVQMRWKNISTLEKYFYNFNLAGVENYQDLVDFDADIIICTIGANIKNSVPEGDPGFETAELFTKEHYKQIIDHFNPGGDAKVIAGTTVFTAEGGEIQTAIKAAADEYGYMYVKMNDLTATEYTAHPYRDQFPDNVIDGVLNHPGDEGMKVMAERLWEVLEPMMDEVIGEAMI